MTVPLVLLRKLHVEGRIALVEAGTDTILHNLVVVVHLIVALGKLVHIAESELWAQSQCGLAVGINQSVADDDTWLMEHNKAFTSQDHTSHTIGVGGDGFTIKLTDVLVSTGGKGVALILVDTKIKLCSMLYDSLIEG